MGAVVVNVTGKYNGRDLDRAEAHIQRLRRKAIKAAGGIGGAFIGASDAIGRINPKLEKAGDALTRNVTLPLVAIGAVSVGTAAAYETSLNQVQAATDATGTEMQKLDDLALKMGADTVFSAKESAEAMLELAKSGMDPAQISSGGLAASLDLAAAGNVALGDSANTTAAAINTFNLKAEDAGMVADALAGGANSSSASVDSLRQALSQVGPQAVNTGNDLNDTVGVLAAFADRGIQGSDAGTSFKTMLQRLVPQTDEAADALEKYGLTFVDSKGNFDDITVVAEKLQQRLGHLSEAERAAALQTIFGSDATRAATVLMGLGAKGTRKYIDATKDRMAAEKMAKARTEGMGGSIEQARGSLETAAIAIGRSLAPTVVQLAGEITDLANAFSNLDPETQTFIVKAGIAVAVAGPLIKSIVGVGNAVKFVIDMTIKAAATQIGAAIFAAMLSPAGLAAIAIGGVVAAIAYMAIKMDHVSDMVPDYTKDIDTMATANDRLKDAVNEASAAERDRARAQIERSRAKRDMVEAEKVYNEILKEHPKNSAVAKIAFENMTEAQLRFADAGDRAAQANRKEFETRVKVTTEIKKTEAATRRAREASQVLIDSVEAQMRVNTKAGSSFEDVAESMGFTEKQIREMKRELQRLQKEWSDVAEAASSASTEQRRASRNYAKGAHASGGVRPNARGGVYPGRAPTVGLLGEADWGDVVVAMNPSDPLQYEHLAIAMQGLGVTPAAASPRGVSVVQHVRQASFAPGAIVVQLPAGTPGETAVAAGEGVWSRLAAELDRV